MTGFSRDSFVRAVVEQRDSCGVAPNAREISHGHAEGRLVGGNLAVLASLCGTPYAPDVTDAILVLEDINEPVYRIDRMLQQLMLSGALQGCTSKTGKPDVSACDAFCLRRKRPQAERGALGLISTKGINLAVKPPRECALSFAL